MIPCELDVIRTLASVGIEDVGKDLLQRPISAMPAHRLREVNDRLQDLSRVSDGLRTVLAFYAVCESTLKTQGRRILRYALVLSYLHLLFMWDARAVPTRVSKATYTNVLDSLHEMIKDQKRPIFQAIRDTPLSGNEAAKVGALHSSTHLWVFAFLSESEGEPTKHPIL